MNLSVLVITHRKGVHLARCLKGILPQLAAEDEVIVVDDGGFDREVVAKVGDPRIRYFPIPHRGYRLATLQNIGTLLARHDAVVKLDGDCIPHHGWLEAYRREIEPGVLCAGRILWEDAQGNIRPDFRFTSRGELSAEALTFRGEYYLPHRVWGGNLAYWRPDFLRLGGFCSEFDGAWGGEESDLGWRYHFAGLKIRFIYDAAVIHQYHPPNPLRNDAEKRRRNLALCEKRRKEYAAGHFPPPLQFPAIHVLITHLGLRPPEETIYPCLKAIRERTTLPLKYWVVLQQPKPGTEEQVLRLLSGEDALIVAFSENRGLAWPKKWVQDQLPNGAWLATVDDDMILPFDGIELMWATLTTSPEYAAVVLYSRGLDFGSLSFTDETVVKCRMPRPELWQEADYAGFGCSLIRPEALQTCHFDDRYFVGGVDLDFCLQLRQLGWKLLILGKEAEHRSIRPPEYRKVRFRNLQHTWRQFELKWGLKIREGHGADCRGVKK